MYMRVPLLMVTPEGSCLRKESTRSEAVFLGEGVLFPAWMSSSGALMILLLKTANILNDVWWEDDEDEDEDEEGGESSSEYQRCRNSNKAPYKPFIICYFREELHMPLSLLLKKSRGQYKK